LLQERYGVFSDEDAAHQDSEGDCRELGGR
jgi:hypothetical protein